MHATSRTAPHRLHQRRRQRSHLPELAADQQGARPMMGSEHRPADERERSQVRTTGRALVQNWRRLVRVIRTEPQTAQSMRVVLAM